MELARVGPFLVLAGNTAAYRDRTATIQVASLAPVLAALLLSPRGRDRAAQVSL